MKKYQKQATKLFEEITEYIGTLSTKEMVELIRKELLIAYLNGALEKLKEI